MHGRDDQLDPSRYAVERVAIVIWRRRIEQQALHEPPRFQVRCAQHVVLHAVEERRLPPSAARQSPLDADIDVGGAFRNEIRRSGKAQRRVEVGKLARCARGCVHRPVRPESPRAEDPGRPARPGVRASSRWRVRRPRTTDLEEAARAKFA